MPEGRHTYEQHLLHQWKTNLDVLQQHYRLTALIPAEDVNASNTYLNLHKEG